MLSVVAIAKNEIKNVRGFLASWSPVADEIIIVDTGSTDGTLEFLQEAELGQHKLRVFSAEWKQDFSAARNAASSKALGTWILWADLDDRLDIQSTDSLKKIVSKRPAMAYAFQVASDMGQNKWQRFLQVRLFPNFPSILFEGKIHETIDKSLSRLGVGIIPEPDIIVAHLGYSDPVLKKSKAIRNLEILLNHPQESPEYFAQVGDALYVLEKFFVGLGYFEEAVRRGGSLIKERVASRLLIGYFNVGALEKADALLLDLNKSCSELDYFRAELFRVRGLSDSAKIYYKKVISGERNLGNGICNGDVFIQNATERLVEMEAKCVLA